MEDLCDNIGLVLVCLSSGSTDVAASPSQYMIQPSGIPILSPGLFIGFLKICVKYKQINEVHTSTIVKSNTSTYRRTVR